MTRTEATRERVVLHDDRVSRIVTIQRRPRWKRVLRTPKVWWQFYNIGMTRMTRRERLLWAMRHAWQVIKM